MTRIAVFLGVVLSILGGVAALDWWIDPLLDRYDPKPLAAALVQPKPCFLGIDVFSTRAYSELKFDYFRQRNARIVAIGSSRVGKLSAWPGEWQFANLNLPGIGPEALAPLFRRLHAEGHGRLTIYLGVEPFWFGRGWTTESFFTTSYVRDAEFLLSTQTLHATLDELRRTPGVIRHPRALRPWSIFRGHGVCVVDRGNSVFAGAASAWAPDGGLWYNDELTGVPTPQGVPFIRFEHNHYTGTSLDKRRVRALRSALGVASGYGWRVVGVSLPLSTYWRQSLERDPQTVRVLTHFSSEMPAIFRAYGFPFLDLLDVRAVPCGEQEFARKDGGHPNGACSRRIRRLLDAAALRIP